jgi:hypothetical protein
MDELREDARNMRVRTDSAERQVAQPDSIGAAASGGSVNIFAGVMVNIDHTTGIGFVRKATGTVGALVPSGAQLRCTVGVDTHIRENKEVVVFDLGSSVDPRYWVYRQIQGICFAKPANIDPAQTFPPRDSATGGAVN